MAVITSPLENEEIKDAFKISFTRDSKGRITGFPENHQWIAMHETSTNLLLCIGISTAMLIL
ncbi:MAG: hypothetical protein IKQ63_07165 [Eubacterium sp.]|nr:hypothetical protein [Eubacterium sp.]